jgi:DNA-directed RNA polymerase specialized sigma24 family protein
MVALSRVRDDYGLRSRSVLSREGAWDPDGEPFGHGFLTGFEERTEVTRLLETLDPRERRLLILWYMEGHPVAAIARSLGISRVHCYRLRDRALRRMIEASTAKAG